MKVKQKQIYYIFRWGTYFKKWRYFYYQGNSKAISQNNTITATDFKFDRKKNIITASNKVKYESGNAGNKFTIFSDEATYFKNEDILLPKVIPKL